MMYPPKGNPGQRTPIQRLKRMLEKRIGELEEELAECKTTTSICRIRGRLESITDILNAMQTGNFEDEA
jgi:uncharacterized coiled-coil protein SlyX